MKKAKQPLTEIDIANAFFAGVKYGRNTAWHKVGEQSPAPKRTNEQIVIVVMLNRYTYDLDVITCAEYNTYINNKNCIGVPVYWGYLRTLIGNKVKFPRDSK